MTKWSQDSGVKGTNFTPSSTLLVYLVQVIIQVTSNAESISNSTGLLLPSELELFVGAPVMFTTNIAVEL